MVWYLAQQAGTWRNRLVPGATGWYLAQQHRNDTWV